MTINITYTTPGRGAWTTGMRSLDGMRDGNQYRSTTNRNLHVIGEEVYQKSRSTTVDNVHINDYAAWRGAVAIQRELQRLGFYKMEVDGRWGPGTDAAMKSWQAWKKTDFQGRNMLVDGIYGQQSARTMWEPRLLNAFNQKANAFAFMPSQPNIDMLNDYAKATVMLESAWDVAAVGYTTPRDLGLCQINTSAHKVTADQAFDPNFAFNFKANLVLDNFNYSLGDLQIAMVSYNVGQGGAWNWHKAGRPKDWAAANYLRNLGKYLTNHRLLEAIKGV